MKILVSLLLLLCAGPSMAGNVYRCADGSFQDKPCGDGGKMVVKNRPAPPPAGPDNLCSRLGRRAEQIAKAKEEGASLQSVLDDIDSGPGKYEEKLEQKKLAVDVYKLGSALEARISVEADCVAAAAKDAAKASEVKRSTHDQAEQQRLSQEERTRFEADRKAREESELRARCERYRNDLNLVKAQQRSVSSGAQADSLNSQKRDIENKLRSSCS